MGYKSYECDHNGRITIYPSLKGPAEKGPGRLVLLIRKLLAQRSATGKGRR